MPCCWSAQLRCWPEGGQHKRAKLLPEERTNLGPPARDGASAIHTNPALGRARHAPNYFGAANQRSNSAISFFWAAMIFLAMAFITGDLPWASSISAMSTAP